MNRQKLTKSKPTGCR